VRATAFWSIGAALLIAAGARGDDWPQWRGPRRDGVWRERGIVERFEKDPIETRWRTPVGPGYAGPAVAAGRVFLTDRRQEDGVERVLSLDARTGKVLWIHAYPCRYQRIGYDSGPRATTTVADGKVFTVGAMGHLHALSAADGRVIWSKDYVRDFAARIPTWGFASAPLLDGERLIALAGGANGAMVIAFQKDTGKEIWRALPQQDMGYAPPVIIEAGGTRQLIVWLPERVVSLDPRTGEVLWQEPFLSPQGLTVMTPVLDGTRLFVSTFYNGSLMLDLVRDRPGAKALWRGRSTSEMEPETDGLHALMATPILRDGHVYGVCSYGALRCLDAKTGERIWATHAATGQGRWWNTFLIPNEDRVFLPNEQGELIIAQLSPEGYRERSRAKLLEPTNRALARRVVWSHPAFAYRHVFARNDAEIVCASLAADGGEMVIE